MSMTHSSGGMLNCGQQKYVSHWWLLEEFILWHISMLNWLCPKCLTSGFHNLDTCHCVGDHHTVSSSSDCCKTLLWTATTFGRIHFQGLLHSIDENSPDLLCKVSSYCRYGSLSPLRGRNCQFCCYFLPQPHCPFFSNNLSGMPTSHWPLHTTMIHCCYRIRKLNFIMASFKFWWSCSWLCWDHTWFLVFENIMLSSWPTLMQQLPWPQLLSRSMCIYRLAMVCSAGVLHRVDGGCPLLCREQ
jgi:hypothetical protein